MKCPLCESKKTVLLTQRKDVPVLQNVICSTREESLNTLRGDIILCLCEDCGFVFNAAYKKFDYNAAYENNQGYSEKFTKYLQQSSSLIAEYVNSLSGKTLILEVGCGQGDYLRQVAAGIGKDKDWQAIGFDPAYRGLLSLKDRLRFEKQYFSHDAILGQWDNIVCIARHVIEHIPDPKFLLKEFECLPGINVKLFLETPDFDWILANGAFEDIVYEHCSFYSFSSICQLLKNFKFDLTRFQTLFNAQYMWIEAEKRIAPVLLRETYKIEEKKLWKVWVDRIHKNEENNMHTLVWGAGAKGVAFLNAIDPEQKYVDGVIDINPYKQGKFLVGTGHPILKPEDLEKYVKYKKVEIIIMNECYLDEISKLVMKIKGLVVKLCLLHGI